MITVSIAGEEKSVTGGKIEMPRTGIWLADLVLDGETIPSGNAVVTLSGVDMPGKILTAELLEGMVHARIIGGAGGMGRITRPKHYRNPTVRHVLGDLLADAGESLSPSCPAEVLDLPLGYWTSLGVPTGTLVQALAEIAGNGCCWRILFDGKLWFGRETWPACPADARIISRDSFNASAEVGTDTMGIWPGTTLEGGRIDRVVHSFGASPRSTVFFVRATP